MSTVCRGSIKCDDKQRLVAMSPALLLLLDKRNASRTRAAVIRSTFADKMNIIHFSRLYEDFSMASNGIY